MRQTHKVWLLLMTVIGLLVGLQTGTVFSQDDENEYVGTRECRACHRSYANDHEETFHALTLVEVEEAEDSPILADFSTGDDIRTITIDGEDMTYTEDDIVYTLGAGRHYQAYVVEVDGTLRVLPTQWSVTDESWVDLTLADNWADEAYNFSSQCAACHSTNFDEIDFEFMEAGVQCEACHGEGLIHVEVADDAGSSISNDEYAELSSAINFGLDAQVCGQCHVRGAHEGTGLPYPVGYDVGGDLSDIAIFAVSMPSDENDNWFATEHARQPNMQYNEWLLSSHGNALETAQSADGFDASCLSCHSVAQNRVNYLIDEDWVDEDEFDPLSVLDTRGFGITCVSCHNPHEVDNDVYLVEEDTYELCVTCHNNGEDNDGIHHPVQEIFEGHELIAEVEPIAGAHFSAEEGPACVTCHMHEVDTKNGLRNSHTFHPVSPAGASEIANLQDACTTCHTTIEDPIAMQALIDGVQANTRDRLARADNARSDDTPEWVTQTIAAIEGDGSMGVHNFAYTNTLLASIESELGIVSDTVSNETVAQQVADTLPVVETTPIPPPDPLVPPVGGLTPPSVVLLGIFGAIVAIAAFTFFTRGGQDD